MNLTKLKLGLTVLVLFGASSSLFVQHLVREKLVIVNTSLQQQLAELTADSEHLSHLALLAKRSLSSPDSQLTELLRLRNQVGMLRQESDELARVQQENQKLLSKIAAHSETTNELSPADQFILKQEHVQNAMNILLAAAKNYATNHGGQNPINFDQLTTSGDLAISNFSGHLSLDDFEFMTAGATNMNGETVILRNRVPIPKPGEDPVWVYGSIEGRGGVMMTPGDFAHSASPPSQ